MKNELSDDNSASELEVEPTPKFKGLKGGARTK
jgi:hypothetical protein